MNALVKQTPVISAASIQQTPTSSPDFKATLIASTPIAKPNMSAPSTPPKALLKALPKAWGGTDYSLVNVTGSVWSGEATFIPVGSRYTAKHPSSPISVKAAKEAQARQDIYQSSMDTAYWEAMKQLPADALKDLGDLFKLAGGGLKNIGKAAVFANGQTLGRVGDAAVDLFNGNHKATDARNAQLSALKQQVKTLRDLVNNARLLMVQNPQAVPNSIKAWLKTADQHVATLRSQRKDAEAGAYVGKLFVTMGKTLYEALTTLAIVKNLPKAIKNAPKMAAAVKDAPATLANLIKDVKDWPRIAKKVFTPKAPSKGLPTVIQPSSQVFKARSISSNSTPYLIKASLPEMIPPHRRKAFGNAIAEPVGMSNSEFRMYNNYVETATYDIFFNLKKQASNAIKQFDTIKIEQVVIEFKALKYAYSLTKGKLFNGEPLFGGFYEYAQKNKLAIDTKSLSKFMSHLEKNYTDFQNSEFREYWKNNTSNRPK